MPQDQLLALAERLAGHRPGGFAGVWPENAAAVESFLAAASQWRTTLGLEDGRLRAVFIGLDYAGAAVAFGAAGIHLDRKLLADLQTLEAAARDALNGALR